MNPNSQNQMHQEIKSAENVQQIFTVLGKYYDLDNSKPGGIAKGQLINNLPKLTTLLSAKVKPQHK